MTPAEIGYRSYLPTGWELWMRLDAKTREFRIAIYADRARREVDLFDPPVTEIVRNDDAETNRRIDNALARRRYRANCARAAGNGRDR